MSFIELFKYLEQHMGYHQFPVNEQATELSNLFDSSAAHHELVVKLSHKIFKANQCQKMQSTIDRIKVDEVLSQVRVEILDGKKTDIDLYHFIEDVCVVVYEFFNQSNGTFDTRAGGAN